MTTPTEARIEEIRKRYSEPGLNPYAEAIGFLMAQLDAANATVQKLEAENAKLRGDDNCICGEPHAIHTCWDDTDMSGLTCPHGSLRRSCEICERDEHIAQLEGELAEQTEDFKNTLARFSVAVQARDVLADGLIKAVKQLDMIRAWTEPDRRHESHQLLLGYIYNVTNAGFSEDARAALTKAGVEK